MHTTPTSIKLSIYLYLHLYFYGPLLIPHPFPSVILSACEGSCRVSRFLTFYHTKLQSIPFTFTFTFTFTFMVPSLFLIPYSLFLIPYSSSSILPFRHPELCEGSCWVSRFLTFTYIHSLFIFTFTFTFLSELLRSWKVKVKVNGTVKKICLDTHFVHTKKARVSNRALLKILV